MAQFDLFRTPTRRWNTGRVIGAEPPLKPKHVWGIRQQLKAAGKVRDLARCLGIEVDDALALSEQIEI